MNLLNSLLDAIVRLEGDALVMHVGEKPYVVTTGTTMGAYRGPLEWGQVELSSRVLSSEAVLSMVGQILPLDQREALKEFGAIEYQIPVPAGLSDRFTLIAARGGDDVWLELRRHRPIETAGGEAAVAAVEEPAAAAIEEPPAPAIEPAAPEAAEPLREAVAPAAAAEAVVEAGEPEATEVSVAAPIAENVTAADDAAAPAISSESTVAEQPVPETPAVAEAETGSPPMVTVTATESEATGAPSQPAETEPWVEVSLDAGSFAEAQHQSQEAADVATGAVVQAGDERAEPPHAHDQPGPPTLAIEPAAAVLAEEPAAVATAQDEAQVAAAIEPAAAHEPPPVVAAEPVAAVLAEEPAAVLAQEEAQVAAEIEPAHAVEQPPVVAAESVAAVLAEEPAAVAAQEEQVAVAIEPAAALEEPPVVAVEPAAAVVAEEPAAVAAAALEPLPAPLVAEAAQEECAPVAEAAPEVEPPAAHERPEARPALVVPMTRRPPRTEPPVPGPVPAFAIEDLLRGAAARGASTVYLVTQSHPLVRSDGDINVFDAGSGSPLSESDIQRIVLDLAPPQAREVWQRGAPAEWITDLADVGRVRCLTFRDHRGPGAIFRMIPPQAISADQLGLTPPVQALSTLSEGLVLVTGPRASGKSTLLSAFVDLINRTRSDHVITIESQIGFVHESRRSFVSQREVRGDAEAVLGAVRAALREGPDVLLIEDLRGSEVVAAALDAADSGRLVFGSLPAPSTVAAIDRLLDLFPADRRLQVQGSLASALRGVVAQVLIRRSRGGRVAAREVLLNTAAVAASIEEGQTDQLSLAMESGRRHGMMPLNDSLAALVRDGTVHVTEAYRKAFDKEGLLAMLKRDGVDTSFAERLA